MPNLWILVAFIFTYTYNIFYLELSSWSVTRFHPVIIYDVFRNLI